MVRLRAAALALVVVVAAAMAVTGGLVSARVARAAEADSPRNVEASAPVGETTEAEHSPSIHPKSLALQLLNFGVLLVILVKFGGGAINKALQARHQQLKTDLASASEARAAAEERLRKNDQRLAGLEQEIAAMRAGIKQEAEIEKARLIAAANERAVRLREETTFVIDQQVKEAQAQLRREVADGAVRIAEQLLRRQVDAQDQQRLLNGFVSDVSAAPSSSAAPAGKAAV